jgi:hypothetical protein
VLRSAAVRQQRRCDLHATGEKLLTLHVGITGEAELAHLHRIKMQGRVLALNSGKLREECNFFLITVDSSEANSFIRFKYLRNHSFTSASGFDGIYDGCSDLIDSKFALSAAEVKRSEREDIGVMRTNVSNGSTNG